MRHLTVPLPSVKERKRQRHRRRGSDMPPPALGTVDSTGSPRVFKVVVRMNVFGGQVSRH